MNLIMSIRTKYSVLFISLLCFAFCSCRKKKEEIKNYNYQLPSTIESYTYFKAGTYWIYQDSATSIMDSVYVTSANKGVKVIKFEDNLGYQGSFGWFSCWMYSSHDNYQYEHWVDQTWEIYGSPTTCNRSKYSTQFSGPNGGNSILYANLALGSNLYSNSSTVTYKAFYNSYILQSDTFNNVKKWYNSQNFTEDRNRTNFYIANNIGIIRKELLDSNKVWNLLRYKIIQ